jgi:hypothetical protein
MTLAAIIAKKDSLIMRVSLIIASGLVICLRWAQGRAYGRIGAEPTYDDVSYLLDGFSRKENFYGLNFGSFKEWFVSPPHSPWSSGMAFLVFCFGGDKGAVYFVNFLAIATLTFILLYLLTHDVTNSLIILLLFLASPFGNNFMVQFRPDAAFAITCGIALTLVAVKKNTIYRFCALYTLGFAFLIKPSHFAFLALSGIAVIAILAMNEDRKNLFRIIGHLIIIVILISLLYAKGIFAIIQYVFNSVTSRSVELYGYSQRSEYIRVIINDSLSQYGKYFMVLFLVATALGFSRFVISSADLKIKVVIITLITGQICMSISTTVGHYMFLYPAIVTSCCVLVLSFYKETFGQRQMYLIFLASLIFISQPAPEKFPSDFLKKPGASEMIANLIIQNNSSKTAVFMNGAVTPESLRWYVWQKQSGFLVESFAVSNFGKGDLNAIVESLRDYDSIVLQEQSDYATAKSSPDILIQREIGERFVQIWPNKRIEKLLGYTVIHRR